MKRTAAALLTLALFAVPASAAGGRQPQWIGSLEDAFALAKERGTAVMVAVNMDGERGNQGMVDNVYTDEDVLKASQDCVPVIASLSRHSQAKNVKCSRFGTVTCDDHITIEDTVRRDWLQRSPKDDVESPRHFFLAPDGRILFQRVWTVDAKTLVQMMETANELCTPEMLENWDTVEARLKRAKHPLADVRAEALAGLVKENDPAIDKDLLASAKSSKDPVVAGAIVGAFAAAAEEDRRKLAHPFLKHKVPEVRVAVAYGMEQSGHTDHIKPLLARVGKEKDDDAAACIYRAVAECGKGGGDVEPNADVIKALIKAYGNSKTVSSRHVAVALHHFASDEKVQEALSEVAFDSSKGWDRGTAAWALGYTGDADIARKLRRATKDFNRGEWRLERLFVAAADKASGKDPMLYEDGLRRLAPHPGENRGDDEDDDRDRGGGR